MIFPPLHFTSAAPLQPLVERPVHARPPLITRTVLNAELTFPVTNQLGPAAPFDSLMFNPQLTTCGGCHANEEQESELAGARTFVSQSLRPRATDQIDASTLSQELEVCDRTLEPERCALLDALMGWGQVTDRDFPVEMAVFGG
jgi:hypothetical protein